MPAAFKKKFPNTTCIVDFSESLLQKPQHLDSRGESHTVKYLVAVAPCGLIMFISAAYGGRCSDKFITRDSGVLDYLMPGDEVMADRGFTIPLPISIAMPPKIVKILRICAAFVNLREDLIRDSHYFMKWSTWVECIYRAIESITQDHQMKWCSNGIKI